MIHSFAITNYLGDRIKLDLREPEVSGFLIKSVTGLGPVKATVNTTEVVTNDGSMFNSARLSQRNIVFQIVFVDTVYGETIEDVRQKSYKYFPAKKSVEIIIETDNRYVRTSGYVESNEPNIFSSQEGTSISIICPDPFFYSAGEDGNNVTDFYSIDPMFEFPFSNESLTEPLLVFGEIQIKTEGVITYYGDAEIGVTIYIHAIGPASNINIYNTETREVMKIDTVKLQKLTGKGIVASDDIVINTSKGDKSITLIREGVSYNILNCLDKNTDWFTLAKGDNIFAFTADSGVTNLQFRIENKVILVLNADFESIAVIDTYESMIWTDRYNSYGDFEIFFAMDTQLLQYLKEDYYLWLKDSEHCMIIEDIKINADTEEGNHLIVTGRSLESILERRIIWGQRIFNGNLQNGIQTMLNECIISPSIADRKISNFVFVPSADPKITSLKIDNQYTGDCLYDVVKGLCEENNIGFKIVLTDENNFAFSLYAGVDRSYEQTENPYVVFSPNFENIINSNYYSSRASFRNVTLVAGEGEGAARRTAIVGSASGLDRRELFTDARDISSDTEDGTLSDAEYMAQLRTKGLKNLADHIVTTAFEGEVEVTRLFKYGEDFFIGDIVQIANEYGNEGSAYISELVISNSEEGLSIYPTFKTISK